MKKALLIQLVILCVVIAGTAYVYPSLPSQLASHWSASGVVNGMLPRTIGVSVLPLLMLFMLGLFELLPRIDPLTRTGSSEVARRMGIFACTILLFLGLVQGLMLYWNLGHQVNLTTDLLIALALLFFVIGRLFDGLPRNSFFGIRTPWTLTNDQVWNETHTKAGFAYQLASLAMLVGLFFPTLALWFLLIPLLVATVYGIGVSYYSSRTNV